MSEAIQASAGVWTREPPKKQGRYWHWNGDEDNAPLPIYVLWSGTDRRCFIAAGQYSIPPGTSCASYCGWWLPVVEPWTPEVVCRRTDGRFHGRDMTCDHCVIADPPAGAGPLAVVDQVQRIAKRLRHAAPAFFQEVPDDIMRALASEAVKELDAILKGGR